MQLEKQIANRWVFNAYARTGLDTIAGSLPSFAAAEPDESDMRELARLLAPFKCTTRGAYGRAAYAVTRFPPGEPNPAASMHGAMLDLDSALGLAIRARWIYDDNARTPLPTIAAALTTFDGKPPTVADMRALAYACIHARCATRTHGVTRYRLAPCPAPSGAYDDAAKGGEPEPVPLAPVDASALVRARWAYAELGRVRLATVAASVPGVDVRALARMLAPVRCATLTCGRTVYQLAPLTVGA